MSAKAMGLSNNVRFTLPGPNNYVPVSYTHLDVYKRQHL